MVSVYDWDVCFKDVLLRECGINELKSNVSVLINELYSHPISVSRSVYDQVREKFNHECEFGWMLFSKDGVVVKAVPTDGRCSRMSYNFSQEQVLREYNTNKSLGFELVGTAHFHTPKEWVYKEFGSPKLASNNDFGIFHKHFPGLSFGDLDEEIFQRISNLERVILLGSQFENEEYNFRAFLAVGNIKYYEKNGVILKLSDKEESILYKNISTLYDENVLPFPVSLRKEGPKGHQQSMVELPVRIV